MNGQHDRNSWFGKRLLAVTSRDGRSVNKYLCQALADGWSASVEDLECFGEAPIGQAALRRRPDEPAAQEFRQLVHVPGLALMRAQGGHLSVERAGHVHVVVGGGPAGRAYRATPQSPGTLPLGRTKNP